MANVKALTANLKDFSGRVDKMLGRRAARRCHGGGQEHP